LRGVERKLLKPHDYARFAGKRAEITLKLRPPFENVQKVNLKLKR